MSWSPCAEFGNGGAIPASCIVHPNPACAIGLLAFKLLLSPSRFSPCVVGASRLFALENRIGGAGVF